MTAAWRLALRQAIRDLAATLLAGLLATAAVLAAMGWGLVRLVVRLRPRLRGPWRYGLANVSRRAGTSVAQIAALGLGLTALLLLVFVRTDLLSRWQQSLPVDAPNRFLLNVQPEQLEPFRQFLAERGIAEPELFPMIRGRLVAVRGQAVTGADFAERGRRAQRLAERKFNLSTASVLAWDNRIVAGRFWAAEPVATVGRAVEFSVEAELAETLGWALGDVVGFDIAGSRLEGRITSLREVTWESFRPNFFVLASPGALEGLQASHITAIHLLSSHCRKILLLVLVIILVGTGKYVYDMHINHNFKTITEGKVYKSGAIPPDEIADFIKEYKIKSVIDLRFPGTQDVENNPEIPEELTAEKVAVERIPGVNHFDNGSDQVPVQKNLDAFFKIMDNPSNYPVLIHCYHGVGRAEIYSALYRIEYEGWDNDKARTSTRFLTKFSSFAIGKPKGDYLHHYVSRKEKALFALIVDPTSPRF